jgi:outer membrane protein OmpA-like peptidoglycan-associated protein
MHPNKKRIIGIYFFGAVALAACNKHGADQPPIAAPAATAGSAASASASTAAAVPAPSSNGEFSVDQVPLASKPLPPFPLLTYPDALPDNSRQNERNVPFEEAWVVAGSALRKVEGRFNSRIFSNAAAGLSGTAARRNYQGALEGLGAVKVNQVQPIDQKLVAADGGDVEKLLAKMKLPDAGARFADRGIATYDSYLLRSSEGNTWVTVTTDTDGLNTYLMTVQEKPLRQSVSALTAERIASALQADGHLALYLSFDTDKTSLRPDSADVMAEVVKLLQADPALRLRIEGHTDNVGNDAHNQSLSAGRADSVKAALVAKGIDGARLETKGFGAARPIGDNASEAGRLKNRRVELVKL